MTAVEDSNPPGELYCTHCEKSFGVGDVCPNDGTRLLRLKARIDPFLGRDLGGRYTILEKLGNGAMGAVYRAEQHSVDREVAVKVVNPNLITEPEIIKRFLREAKLASKLSHPNAVSVLEFDQTDDGTFYLVMELVTGRTLDDVIDEEKVFSASRVVRIGTQILDALDAAHRLSIIHRDLKPSNIMMLSHGRDLVKVLDFGLAKSIAPDHAATTMTGTNAIVGTPAFIPPELARGMTCDGRADLYSLGVILYLLGAGHLPFESESVHELVALHGSDEPAPPMPNVPRPLGAVIDKLLQKVPANRYQTAAEALADLEGCLASVTPLPGSLSTLPAQSLVDGRAKTAAAPAVALSQVSPRTRARWPIVVGALGALAAVSVGVVVLSMKKTDDAPAQPTPIVEPAKAIPEPAVEPPPTPTPSPPPDPTPPVTDTPPAPIADVKTPDTPKKPKGKTPPKTKTVVKEPPKEPEKPPPPPKAGSAELPF